MVIVSSNMMGNKTFPLLLNISENYDYTIAERSFSISIWIMISVVGNAMLFGIVQNSRLQGDPLKRRITDQVSKCH